MVISFLVYNTIVLLPLVLSPLLNQKKVKGGNQIIIFICLLYTIVLTGIRCNVGRDFQTYADIFVNPYHMDRDRLEYGFYFLVKILNYFTYNTVIFFAVVSALIYSLIFCTYKQYKSWIVIILWFLLFFLISLNVLRQAIGMAFLFYAFYYIDINRIKYYSFVILGGLFHITSLIGLIFPLLSRVKIRFLEIWVLFTPLLAFISIVDVLREIVIIGDSYYAFYLEDNEIYAGKQTISIGGIARLIIPFTFIFYFRKDFEPKINLLKNAMFIYISLYFLSLNFYILYRVYFIFQLLIPVVCWYLFKEKNKKIKYIIYFYIIILLVFFQKNIFESTIYPKKGNSIFPYQTIFTLNPVQ